MAIPAARPSKALFLILLLAGRELVQCERMTTHLHRLGICESASCAEVNGQCPVEYGCCVWAWKERSMFVGYSKSCTAVTAEVLAQGMILHSKALFRHLHDFGVNGGLLNFWGKGMFEHLGAFLEVLSSAKTADYGAPTTVGEYFWKNTFYDFQLGLTQMAQLLQLDASKVVFSFGTVDFGEAVGLSNKNAAQWMFTSVRSGMGNEDVLSRLNPGAAKAWQAMEAYQPNNPATIEAVALTAMEGGLDKFPPGECIDIMAKKTNGDVLQQEATEQGYDEVGLLEEFAVRHREALLDISSDHHRDVINSYLDHKSSLLQLSSDALAKAQVIVFEVIMTIVAFVFLIVVIYYTVQSSRETTWEEKKWATSRLWADFKEMFSKDTRRVRF